MIAPRLATPRLVLRATVPGDAAALFPAFSDAETMRWWSCPPFASVDALAGHLAAGPPWTEWTVCESGAAIGRVSLRDHRPGVGEIGYLFARERWGRGLAREAVGAVIAHGFGALGLRRIFADSDPDNAGSIATLRALGFALEARLRAEWETHIGIRDSLIFGLLASDRRG